MSPFQYKLIIAPVAVQIWLPLSECISHKLTIACAATQPQAMSLCYAAIFDDKTDRSLGRAKNYSKGEDNGLEI